AVDRDDAGVERGLTSGRRLVRRPVLRLREPAPDRRLELRWVGAAPAEVERLADLLYERHARVHVDERVEGTLCLRARLPVEPRADRHAVEARRDLAVEVEAALYLPRLEVQV